jgi:orotate phosphoribosyltransferase
MGDHTPEYSHAFYLEACLERDKTDRYLRKAVRVLKDIDFDAIAFRGMSGALIAPLLAHKLGKTLIMVRKRGVDCHSGHCVEGDRGARRWIIVDDFISSGHTVETIKEEVDNWMDGAEFLGTLEFSKLEEADWAQRNVLNTYLAGAEGSNAGRYK